MVRRMPNNNEIHKTNIDVKIVYINLDKREHTNLKDFSKQKEFGVSAQVKVYVCNQKEDLASD